MVKFGRRLKEPIDERKRSRSRSPSPSPSITTLVATDVASPSSPSGTTALPLCSLWDAALKKLPATYQAELLQLNALSRSASAKVGCVSTATPAPASIDIAALCALAVKHRDACEQGRWKFAFGGRGEVIVLRDAAAKVIAWLDKFKQAGDIAIQYDPHHFALPWAGVRLLLEVCRSLPCCAV